MRMHDSRLIEADCEQVFGVLADIERYPEFLPGWEQARVVARHAGRLEVEQTVRAGPIPVRFRTEALLDAPRRLDIRGTAGPFRRLHIEWRLEPAAKGCHVRLAVSVEVRLGPLAALIESRFRHQARDLLGHFERRVHSLGSHGQEH